MKRIVLGAAALAPLALALGACTSSTPKPAAPAPARSATTGSATPRATTAAPSASATGPAVPGRLELSARLTSGSAYPGATGIAEYDQDDHQRELEVSLARVPQLAGRRVTVYVNGSRAGSITVSASGRAHADWDTEHGDTVPHPASGSRAEVRTASGTVVVSGTFTREPED